MHFLQPFTGQVLKNVYMGEHATSPLLEYTHALLFTACWVASKVPAPRPLYGSILTIRYSCENLAKHASAR